MNRKLLYLLIFPVLITACKPKCIEDLGIHSSRDYTLKPFDEIRLSGPIRLVMRQDSSFKVNVQADSSVIGLVKAEVSGHRLDLKLDAKQYCGKDSIIISAGIGALKKIESDGAGHIYTSSLISVGDLELDLSGATMLMMQMNAAKLTTTTDGAANIVLLGQAGVHQLKSKGAVELTAFDFVTGVSDLTLEGVAKLKINVLNDLKINSTGSSSISYKGSPKNLEEKKTGTYKLEKVN
ncbi:Putative auto-transporter adhesin, head GIN domain [Pedobacter hartonius]|uniref:Putative auto-transporter adhesin, head GIN domain n=2 Tax=Pedobacter hartonius TaxID=425514 RepID=A0A1H4H0X4_9SPHI|nr:Putative auto-transporter adhesin, head GIN domain [Pedobacter hartonius]